MAGEKGIKKDRHLGFDANLTQMVFRKIKDMMLSYKVLGIS